MVRMADILKKREEEEEKAATAEVQKEKSPEAAGKAKLRAPKVEEARPKEKAKEVKGEPICQTFEEIYKEALAVIKAKLKEAKKGKVTATGDIIDIVEKIVERVMSNDNTLLSLTTTSTPGNYLWVHSVNCCMLAINLGLALGYRRNELVELGFGALLHDVGMVKVLKIAHEPRELASHEYEKIKRHPIYGNEILRRSEALIESAREITYQHHERINGRGYPRRLEKEEIHEYAQIVSLADVYEALTHPRSYRDEFPPHEAMRMIINGEGGAFSSRILKALINLVTIYPVGSWIELNTREIGKVVEINKGFPLRPVVSIMFDPDGKRLKEIKSVNLKDHPALYIKGAVDKEKAEVELEGR